MRERCIRFVVAVVLAAVWDCASAVAPQLALANDGAAKPQATESVPAAVGGDIAAEPVPTVQQIIDRALESMGGREAIAKIESMCVRWEVADIPGYEMEDCFASEGRILIVSRNPAERTVHGSDGRVGWREIYRGERFHQSFFDDTKVLRGMAFARMGLPYYEEFLKAAERAERGEFDGQPAYRLIVPADAMNAIAVYFSIGSGLPLGYSARATAEEPDAPVSLMYVLADWKLVGDIQFPHRMKQINFDVTSELIAKSVEVNTIDPAIFTAPEKKPSTLPTRPWKGKAKRPDAAALHDVSVPLTAEQIETLSLEETRQRMGAVARELRQGTPDPPARERLDREFKQLVERLRRLQEPKQT